jgi:hypothetical protein
MTCIVGIAENGKVYMGGDSGGVTDSWLMTTRVDRKVFTTEINKEEIIIGFTTSFRMGQLLQYHLAIPDYAMYLDPEVNMWPDPIAAYMQAFVEAIRSCFKSYGSAKKENEVESGGEFLIGFRGRLFKIGSDYQVGESEDGYDAAGWAAPIALGALYATTRPVKARPRVRAIQDPGTRIRIALEAAHRFHASVRPPFIVLEPYQ